MIGRSQSKAISEASDQAAVGTGQMIVGFSERRRRRGSSTDGSGGGGRAAAAAAGGSSRRKKGGSTTSRKQTSPAPAAPVLHPVAHYDMLLCDNRQAAHKKFRSRRESKSMGGYGARADDADADAKEDVIVEFPSSAMTRRRHSKEIAGLGRGFGRCALLEKPSLEPAFRSLRNVVRSTGGGGSHGVIVEFPKRNPTKERESTQRDDAAPQKSPKQTPRSSLRDADSPNESHDAIDGFRVSSEIRKKMHGAVQRGVAEKMSKHASRSLRDVHSVIVEFPEHNRSRTMSTAQRNVSEEEEQPKVKNKSPWGSRTSRTSQGHNSSSRSRDDGRIRQFEDTGDWRNSSIDWGDNKDDDGATVHEDYGGDDPFRPKKVSPRQIDPSVSRRQHPRKNAAPRCCPHRSSESTESCGSMLSQSFSSLL